MTNIRPALRSCIAALAFLLVNSPETPLYAQGLDEYIVQFQDGTPPAARRVAAANAGAAIRFVYTGVSAAAVQVPNEQALVALRRNPAIVSIVPNRPIFAYQHGAAVNGNPNRGGDGGQQGQVIPAGVMRVGVPTASSNGSGIGVAVLDTGIDLAHLDLAVAITGFSAVGASCQDDHGHGTHVAGTIAARGNGADVVGVAPAAQLYCVKVLDNSGSGSDATVMAGLDWVLNNHDRVVPAIKVINLSLGRAGTVGDNPAMHGVISALDSAGISVVAAAGNDPQADVSEQIPAAYAEVIAVASTTAQNGSNQCRFLAGSIAADTASYFTTDGHGVTVSAPGEDQEDVNRSCLIKSVGILSTRLGGGTTRMSGTSMASPHVAGIAARYYQQNSTLLPSEVKVWIATGASRQTVAPLNSPSSSYTYDGVKEGIAQAPTSITDP
jgi:subtilisin